MPTSEVLESTDPMRKFNLLLLSTLALSTTAFAQIAPSQDSLTYSGSPSTNYGASQVLNVTSTQTSYIQFNLSSIPAGAAISQATLKLYVSSVATPGSFNVNLINGSWSENTLSYSNAPPMAALIATSTTVTTANQYVLTDVTLGVLGWLNGTQPNNGIALVPNGAFHATFDSKENTTTSHPPELDIVFAEATGTITGVTAGAGLSGGGTSGNVTLNNTGILGLTAGAGIAVSGGQTPTISIGSSVPLLTASNTFSADQTVNGNLSATGTVSGRSYRIGGNPFAFGSFTARTALLGFAGNSTMTGGQNTAVGFGALQGNTSGIANTASGLYALRGNTSGTFNTAYGDGALAGNTTGSYNVVVGGDAFANNTIGSSNIAIGVDAGDSAPVGNSNSIYIGAYGSANDNSGTIQIGAYQTGGTFIAGISGANVSGGVPVYINSNGQLGTVLSSRRFKTQIADMGDSSSKLLQLRPVTYYYKPEFDDGSHDLQYGLIAEEVAKIYPEMVAYDKDGRVMTVKYQLLAPMLLNEVQKQHAQAEKLRRRAEQQDETIHRLQQRLAAIEAMLGNSPASATGQ